VAIEVVPYDPVWRTAFAEIQSELSEALRGVPIRGIAHIGSTAVPGLAAKPQIDIDIIVRRDDLHQAIAALTAIGYEHRGDLGILDRHAMRAPRGASRRNVYVVIDGSLALRNHLAVRGALRADEMLRDAYGALKLSLADEVEDIGAYVEGKTDLLVGILRRAGFTEDEIEAVRAANRHVDEPPPHSPTRRGSPRRVAGCRRRR
jgi:GrpB-like predicted nucleotidyltransferase (UPF0157 family)